MTTVGHFTQPSSIMSSTAIAPVPMLTPIAVSSTMSSQQLPPLHHHHFSAPVPGHPVAEFLYHLTRMLTEVENNHLIEWDAGRIRVHDPPRLEREVLHKYFKHSKYASFQRQLNYFGFRKIAGKGKMSPCSYVNDAVTTDLRSLLSIKRRTHGAAAAKKAALQDGKNKTVKKVEKTKKKKSAESKKRKQEKAEEKAECPHTSSSKKQRTMPPPVSPTPSSFSIEGNDTCTSTIDAFPQAKLEQSFAQTAPMVVTADEFGAPFTNPALFAQHKPQSAMVLPPTPQLVPVEDISVHASASTHAHEGSAQETGYGNPAVCISVPNPLNIPNPLMNAPVSVCEAEQVASSMVPRSSATVVSDCSTAGDESSVDGSATGEELHSETTCFLKNLLGFSDPTTSSDDSDDLVLQFVESMEMENQQRRKKGLLTPSPSLVNLAMLPSCIIG